MKSIFLKTCLKTNNLKYIQVIYGTQLFNVVRYYKYEDIFMYIIIIIILLGLSFTSNLGSVRVVIFILFFTTLFVFTLYSASIVVLIQSNSNSIKSIRDIVESPMTFSAQITPYGKHYFEVSKCMMVYNFSL